MIELLLKAIDTIVGVVANSAANKAKKSEVVVKTLKKLKLDPKTPPADFENLYIYTLVEYGIDKPRVMLEFFRHDFIIEAFRASYDKGKFDRLEEETTGLLEWNQVGQELALIRRDPRQEFVEFLATFEKMVDRSRTPAESRRERKLDELRKDSKKQLQELERIKTQLEQKGQSSEPVKEQELKQNLKDWFGALSYRWEQHEQETQAYFEWLIQVPARRGFDRIVVRGYKRRVEAGDVQSLNQVVRERRADEGWIVTTRRISPAARGEAKSQECNGRVFCYTFDELVDETADFSHYFDWLEEEVKSRKIDQMYVQLGARKTENFTATVDNEAKVALSVYDEKTGWLEGYIEQWLDDPAKEHISILGEFGTGKSWFTLHFAWEQLKDYKRAKAAGRERPRVPLVIPLRDYAKAVSVESLFSEFFFRKHEIRLPGYSAFEQLNRMGKLLLIFDGFDEMADKIDRQKVINNFWELAKVVVPGSKAILTCRTEHFPTDKESRELLNAELKASTAALTGEPPQFEVLELMPLNKEQIEKVLNFRARPETVKRVMDNEDLVELAQRPVMIEYIVDALPEIEEGKPVDMSRVYLYATQRKMRENIREGRTFTSLADKLYFLCELSWEMLSTEQMSLNYRAFPDRLRRLFEHAVQDEKDLDHWHYDMMGQTMLIRNADGDYKPAHRSLLEFFVAYKLAAELGLLAEDFTAVAREQSNVNEKLTEEDYSWSDYFRREVDKQGKVKLIAPLKNFKGEGIEKLVSRFGEKPLAKAVMDLLVNMLPGDKEAVKQRLLEIIKFTCGKEVNEVGFVGGNAATLLVRCDGVALRGCDLVGANLRKADLTGAILAGSNLSQSDLAEINATSTNFKGCNLAGVNFAKANLKWSFLEDCNLCDANFSRAQLWGARLRFTRLNNANFLDVKIASIPGSTLRYFKSEINDNYIYFLSPKDVNRLSINWSEHLSNISSKDIKRQFLIISSSKEDVWPSPNMSTVKWIRPSNTAILVVLNTSYNSNVMTIMSIEGEIVRFNRKTGEDLPQEDALEVLFWKDADLAGAQGLDERNAYIAKLLGAINVPETNYDPHRDKELLGFEIDDEE